MKQIAIAGLVLAFTANSLVAASRVMGQTYSFMVPDHVIFESHQDMEFYTFRWGKAPHVALFMLNANPAPLTVRALKPMADMMAVTFEDQIKKQIALSDIQTERTELQIGPFEGIQIAFTMKQTSGDIMLQYMLILHDGDRAWNAQLTANTTNDILTAHAIMQTAEKIAKQPENSNKE